MKEMNFKSDIPDHQVYEDAQALASAFAKEFTVIIQKRISNAAPVNIALSGGTTPLALFRILAENFSRSVDWTLVHFFWVDERCVSPDNAESNFGNAKKIFFDITDLSSDNVHRIRGEDEPCMETLRYASEIKKHVRYFEGWPQFDIILLGMGEDGHTASIFPDNLKLLTSEKICETARHPVTGQSRISLTGKVLNNASMTFLLVTGRNKAPVVAKVFNNNIESAKYPVNFIKPINGHLKWYLDSDAASLLNTDGSC